MRASLAIAAGLLVLCAASVVIAEPDVEVIEGELAARLLRGEVWRVEVSRVTDTAGNVEEISYRYVASVKGSGVEAGTGRTAVVVRYHPGTFRVPVRGTGPTTGPATAPATRPAALTGRWFGPYENSRKEAGSCALNLVEGAGGALTGDWGDPSWPITSGQRTGPTLTFYGRHGTREYWGDDTVSPEGRSMRVTYRVVDTSRNPPQHSGTHYVSLDSVVQGN